MSPVESMQRILSMAEKDPVFRDILHDIAAPTKDHINITGMTDSQKAYIACALSQKTNRKPVILVPDELRARTLQLDISAFCDGEVLILRQRELNLADVDASSREAELSRIGVLRRLLAGDFGAVIITAGALMNRLMPAGAFLSFANPSRGLEPIDLRHLHVHENQVERVFSKCISAVPRTASGRHACPSGRSCHASDYDRI